MKNLRLSVFALLLLFSCQGKHSRPAIRITETHPKPPRSTGVRRILMVGNSHTEFFISLPDLISVLCTENDVQVEVDKLVEMGVSIPEILEMNKAKADRLFARKDPDGNYYDFIILQDKTSIVLEEPELYAENCSVLLEQSRKYSPQSAVYIYELMAPFPYNEHENFAAAQKAALDNATIVAQNIPNAGVLYIGERMANAYAGKYGYQYMVHGKDALRFGKQNLHMLNDAGFMSSIYIYKTLFGIVPVIPKQLPLSTGIKDTDEIKWQDVERGISNPDALIKIAED